jgi:hypothetical protein
LLTASELHGDRSYHVGIACEQCLSCGADSHFGDCPADEPDPD